MWTIWDDITEEGRGDEKVRLKRQRGTTTNSLCAGRLFHAAGADIENELSTQRRRERGKM